jgi:hypothetical protein
MFPFRRHEEAVKHQEFLARKRMPDSRRFVVAAISFK